MTTVSDCGLTPTTDGLAVLGALFEFSLTHNASSIGTLVSAPGALTVNGMEPESTSVEVSLKSGTSPEMLRVVVERITRAFGGRVTRLASSERELSVRAILRSASAAETKRLREQWFSDLPAVETVRVEEA
jgi:hypothetical protein